MKYVGESHDFNVFINEIKQRIKPIIHQQIENTFNETNKAILQNKKKAIFIAIAITLGLLILSSIVALIGENASFVIAGILGFLTIVGIITTAVLLILYNKKLWEFSRLIERNLDRVDLYNQVLKTIDKNFNFYGNIKELNQNDIDFTKSNIHIKEHKWYKPSMVELNANISKVGEKLFFDINNKYPICCQSVLWEYVYKTKDKEEVYYYNATLIKIDVSKSKHENFAFGMFGRSCYNGQKIKLENNEFNKMVNLYSNNEFIARKIYTPLAMENTVKHYRLNRKKQSSYNLSILSNGNITYASFLTPDGGFLKIDVPARSNVEKVEAKILEDILRDIFTYYYVINYLFIPLYLD